MVSPVRECFIVLLVQLLSYGGHTEQSCPTNREYDHHTDQRHMYAETSRHFNPNCKPARQSISRDTPYQADPRFKGVYTFPVRSIPRKECSDPDAMASIDNGIPVILENCTFAKSALKWSIEYLLENLRDKGHPTYVSSSRRFLYYDVDRVIDKYEDWTPPTTRKLILFQEFVEMAKEIEKSNNGTRSYFQSPLYIGEGVSTAFENDINAFDYPWLLDIVQKQGWGTDVINLLLVGMPDVVTPAHYDILENFFVQISGFKRVILFSPEYFRCLYPFPVAHPHDRQTQINFDDPDFEKFPRFKDIEGVEGVVGPGDVLYLPNYWWHYIESGNNNMTVSVNFWFEPTNVTTKEEPTEQHQPNEDIEKNSTGLNETITEEVEKKPTPLSPADYLALIREVEGSLFKATNDHSKVRELLDEILNGRFDFLDAK